MSISAYLLHASSMNVLLGLIHQAPILILSQPCHPSFCSRPVLLSPPLPPLRGMKIIASRWACTRPNTPAPPSNLTRTIPASMRGTPWFDDGNIIILTGDGETAFKSYMGLLLHNSAWFEERLCALSDDSAEVVDGCALIQLDKEDSARDMSHFLTAMHNGITSVLHTGTHAPPPANRSQEHRPLKPTRPRRPR